MNVQSTGLFTCAAWLALALTTLSCKQEKDSLRIMEREGNQYLVQTQNRSMLVNAATGARIVSLQFKGKELLFQQTPTAVDFGSTFWPDPQSNWNWPPYEMFQTGPFQASIADGRLVLLGQRDPKAGLAVNKVVGYDKETQAFSLEYHLKNMTDSVRSAGPWEVTCVPTEGLVFFPAGEEPDGTNGKKFFHTIDGIAWLDLKSANLGESQKYLNLGSAGWLAHVTADHLLFVKKFPFYQPQDIAPGQGQIEVYVNMKEHYMELENHGKYTAMQPGDSVVYPVSWYVRSLPTDIEVTVGNQKLVDFVEALP